MKQGRERPVRGGDFDEDIEDLLGSHRSGPRDHSPSLTLALETPRGPQPAFLEESASRGHLRTRYLAVAAHVGCLVEVDVLHRNLGTLGHMPFLEGYLRDSCVVCNQGTDTGMVFTGSAEWLIGGLMSLGIPEVTAHAKVINYFRDNKGAAPGMVLDGEHTIGVTVCAECVAKAPEKNFPPPRGIGRWPHFQEPS
jgi:hypothetical protein